MRVPRARLLKTNPIIEEDPMSVAYFIVTPTEKYIWERCPFPELLEDGQLPAKWVQWPDDWETVQLVPASKLEFLVQWGRDLTETLIESNLKELIDVIQA